jgi:uncharacterized membrane protein HdeD (DUF308 family)
MSAFVRLWWLSALVGLASAGVGTALLTEPDHSLRALAVIVEIFVLLDGAVEFARSFGGDTSNRGLVAVLGSLNLIAGVLLIRHPIAGVPGVAIVAGLWLTAAAVIRAVLAYDGPREARLARLIVAMIEGVFGIIILASPHIGYDTLATLLGVSLIANGLAMIFFAFASRRGGFGGPAAVA